MCRLDRVSSAWTSACTRVLLPVMTGTPRNVRGAGVGAEIFRLPPSPGDDDSIFSGGQLAVCPLLAETCFGGPLGPAGMKSRRSSWCGRSFGMKLLLLRLSCILYPGIHPGVALLISGPSTHTPIIIIIIIIIKITNRKPRQIYD